jgi:hypothetical protein
VAATPSALQLALRRCARLATNRKSIRMWSTSCLYTIKSKSLMPHEKFRDDAAKDSVKSDGYSMKQLSSRTMMTAYRPSRALYSLHACTPPPIKTAFPSSHVSARRATPCRLSPRVGVSGSLSTAKRPCSQLLSAAAPSCPLAVRRIW